MERLYQRPPVRVLGGRPRAGSLASACALAALFLAACVGPRATAGALSVVIEVDGGEVQASVPVGSTVIQSVEAAGISLGALDQLAPPGYTVVSDQTRIQITRLTESFEVEQTDVPFPQQTLRSEALPEGETRLLQAGENGLQETTYRVVQQEGVEITRTAVKVEVIREPRPEIVMIGTLTAYVPVPIDGTLAYVASGNVWTVSGDSGSRTPLTVGGDADGRILELSPRADWLAFTRSSADDPEAINSLWAVATFGRGAEAVSLDAGNIVHFADWSPDRSTLVLAYSTVEPRPAAPGWQANNDLWLQTLRPDGDRVRLGPRRQLIPSNSGGQYGWWGSTFTWAPDGLRLAYARPDGIGQILVDDPGLQPVLEGAPYQTLGDWAWVPGVGWGWDSRTLYAVQHGAPVGLETEAASPVFDLVAIQGTGGSRLELRPMVGMFAEPVVSPPQVLPNGEVAYRVAFLQAVTPLESEASRYRLVVIDRDGSNARTIFPADGEPGIEPHRVAWSPDGERVAVIYQGDLWVVDVASGQAHRLTSDGQVSAVDWGG